MKRRLSVVVPGADDDDDDDGDDDEDDDGGAADELAGALLQPLCLHQRRRPRRHILHRF